MSKISDVPVITGARRKAEPDGIEISIVIVTWNSASEIESCLNSIVKHGPPGKIEVIIIDNASSDNTPEILRKYSAGPEIELKVIENKKNTGYTAANNRGFEAAKGKYVLLLNPDTILSGESSLNALKKFLNLNKSAGAAAPQLLNSDGSIQFSCRTFPRYWDMFCEITLLARLFPGSKIFSRWKMKYFSHNELRKVDQPMAASLMIKSEVLKKVNFFDPDFNMFFNDVDLCRKIYDSGYEIYFIPDAKIYHLKGVSIYKDRKRMINVWNQDCLKYFRKYHYNFFLFSWLRACLNVTGYFRRLFSSS